MTRRLATLALSLAFAWPASAQDRAGRDTPGEWTPAYFARYGPWDVTCDQRGTGARHERRCYLRLVDVFSSRPDFAAHFLFVVPNPGGEWVVEYGSERGTRFRDDGFRIDRAGTVLRRITRDGCLRGRACLFHGVEAETLAAELAGGTALRFDFTDRHGIDRMLSWDLTPFAAALADLKTRTKAHAVNWHYRPN